MSRRSVLIVGLAIAGSVLASTPATAKPIDKGHFDDVFTSGNTLNAVAGALKGAGAHSVHGLSLARQQWAADRP